MFQIDTYLLKRFATIKEEGNLDRLDYDFLYTHTEECFIQIDSEEDVKTYIDENAWLLNQAIIIHYQGKALGGFRFWGLGLWDEVISICEAIVAGSKEEWATPEVHHNKLTIKMSLTEEDRLEFTVIQFHDRTVMTSQVLPKREFLLALLNEAHHYYTTMIGYHYATEEHTPRLQHVVALRKRVLGSFINDHS